jgi:hypothetical protein
VTDWDVIGRALRKSRPRYPREAGVACALLVAASALAHRDWTDLVFAGIGAASAAYLTYRHRAAVRLWERGADSFRRLTGRDP